MSIEFACQGCQKKYRVEDRLGGKRANCKGCGASMQIPAAAATAARAVAAPPLPPPAPRGRPPALKACPDCGEQLPAGAVLCTNCGFNTQTGGHVTTRVEAAPALPLAANPAAATRRSRAANASGGPGPGPAPGAVWLAVMGIGSCILPLFGYQFTKLAALGAFAPVAGLLLAILGAVIYFVASRPAEGTVVIVGGLVAFVVYWSVMPILARQDEKKHHQAAEAGAEQQAQAEQQQRADAADAARREREERAERARTEQQEAAQRLREQAEARARQMNPNYVPPTPAHDLPANPLERELYLVARGNPAERFAAVQALLTIDVPAARRDEVAAIFRGLIGEAGDRRVRPLGVRGIARFPDEQTVPTLTDALANDDAPTRRAAMAELARIKDERAIEPLVRRLVHDPAEATEALKPFARPLVQPALLAMLKDPDPPTRAAAARALGALGSRDVVPALREAAKDADGPVILAAVAAWKQLAPEDLAGCAEGLLLLARPATQNAGLAKLADADPDSARRAEVVQLLCAHLGDAERHADDTLAAAALAKWASKDSVPALLAMLAPGGRPGGHRAAIGALAALNDPRGADAIAGCIDTFWDREPALAALEQMGPASEDALCKALRRTDNEQVGLAIVSLLGRVGTSKCLPTLRALAYKTTYPALGAMAKASIDDCERRNAELVRERLRKTPATATTKKAA